jgi:hypothetical protein
MCVAAPSQIDVAPTGQRLRRRFGRGDATGAVYAFVRAAVARAAAEAAAAANAAPDAAAAALAAPGGLVLVAGFPPFAPLLEAHARSLGDAGVARRDKLIARAAAAEQ